MTEIITTDQDSEGLETRSKKPGQAGPVGPKKDIEKTRRSDPKKPRR